MDARHGDTLREESVGRTAARSPCARRKNHLRRRRARERQTLGLRACGRTLSERKTKVVGEKNRDSRHVEAHREPRHGSDAASERKIKTRRCKEVRLRQRPKVLLRGRTERLPTAPTLLSRNGENRTRAAARCGRTQEKPLRRAEGEKTNPSATSGPGLHAPNQKPTGNPSRTKIRAEIKALNTQGKISDLEPTQTRCKLEIFH
jgi:IS4 transposase